MAINDRDDLEPEQKAGCLNLGWGCLPALAFVLALPLTLFF